MLRSSRPRGDHGRQAAGRGTARRRRRRGTGVRRRAPDRVRRGPGTAGSRPARASAGPPRSVGCQEDQRDRTEAGPRVQITRLGGRGEEPAKGQRGGPGARGRGAGLRGQARARLSGVSRLPPSQRGPRSRSAVRMYGPTAHPHRAQRSTRGPGRGARAAGGGAARAARRHPGPQATAPHQDHGPRYHRAVRPHIRTAHSDHRGGARRPGGGAGGGGRAQAATRSERRKYCRTRRVQ